MVGTALIAMTPAVSQFVLFFGTLVFFLATSATLRQKLVVAFWTRDARLRMLRIWNDIEENLVGYVGLVTLIKSRPRGRHDRDALSRRLSQSADVGLLTVALNYIPYIGPAIIAVVLFCVGVVAMPSLPQAALAPALFVAIATAEGHFITRASWGGSSP